MNPKTIIAPLQQWLLTQGRCVGCGRPLKGGKQRKINGIVQVTCNCHRIFIYKPSLGSYRRAEFQEVLFEEGR
jgi:hypothetical protein